jgi:hypothetical protein
MREWLRDHGLLIANLALFLIFFGGMVLSGVRVYNSNQLEHGEQPVSLAGYLLSGDFYEATFENWESEFLQMAAYVMLTAVLFQRGSAESRDPDEPERDGDELPRDWRSGQPALRWMYAHSLGLALMGLFILSFGLHQRGSLAAANEEAMLHGTEIQTLWAYLGDARFRFESFQNWQSEFLSTAVLVVLSIFLRFKNSPESKPVSAAHSETGA